jgi:hypothetical protein
MFFTVQCVLFKLFPSTFDLKPEKYLSRGLGMYVHNWKIALTGLFRFIVNGANIFNFAIRPVRPEIAQFSSDIAKNAGPS